MSLTPVPPIVDQDRVQSYSILASTPSIALAYPLFGDGTDIIITLNGSVLSPTLYAVSSMSNPGANLDTLPLPITDGLVTFTPPITSGALVITYIWRPRTGVLPDAPGIARQEFNIDYTQVVASLRELLYRINSLNLTPINLSALLDAAFGSTSGDVLVRGATVWAATNLGVGPLPTVASAAALRALSVAGLIAGQLVFLESGTFGGNIYLLTTSNPGADDGAKIIWSNTAGFFYVRQYVDAPSEPGGRLTLSTGLPVMTAPVAASATVLYTPSKNANIPIWSGALFSETEFSELTNTLSDATKNPAAAAASSVYDLFVWSDAGTIRLGRGPAWTNSTTRSAGTALNRVKGIAVNNASITNGPAAGFGTYVGTIATDAGGATVSWSNGGSGSGGVLATLNVWNMYNRVSTAARVIDSGATYSGVSSGTFRQARASVNNQINFVTGLAEEGISASYSNVSTLTATSGASVSGAVGFDSTTSAAGSVGQGSATQAAANTTLVVSANVAGNIPAPQPGSHFLAALEASNNGANVLNASTVNTLSAMLKM